MSKLRFVPGPVLAVLCVLMFASRAQTADSKEPMHVEMLLIWGTNDPMSPDPDHKPVDAELARKFAKSPYRWKYYYQVNRQHVTLGPGETRKGIKMSSKCVLDMTNPADGKIEVIFHGDGKKLLKHNVPFPMGEHYMLGGDAKNETAWFVVLKRVESPPKAEKPAPK
jgi:hypothetical protein